MVLTCFCHLVTASCSSLLDRKHTDLCCKTAPQPVTAGSIWRRPKGEDQQTVGMKVTRNTYIVYTSDTTISAILVSNNSSNNKNNNKNNTMLVCE